MFTLIPPDFPFSSSAAPLATPAKLFACLVASLIKFSLRVYSFALSLLLFPPWIPPDILNALYAIQQKYKAKQ